MRKHSVGFLPVHARRQSVCSITKRRRDMNFTHKTKVGFASAVLALSVGLGTGSSGATDVATSTTLRQEPLQTRRSVPTAGPVGISPAIDLQTDQKVAYTPISS